jgi:hypothetical protein
MDNLCKLNYLSYLSFIIIGIFLYITSDGHQSFSAQEGGGEEEATSDINNDEESNSNDIFSDLSRNLPRIDEKALNENGEPLESDEPLFGNPDTEALNENEMDNSENIVESNEQGVSSQSIEKSLNSEFSDSDKETDIINEDGDDSEGNIETSSSPSSSNEVSNDEEDNNNNNNIINNSD